jgi:hypothetical protein
MHKRTHLGKPRRSKHEETKPVTAAPPPQGRMFMAPTPWAKDGSALTQERHDGCYRTYIPSDGEGEEQ